MRDIQLSFSEKQGAVVNGCADLTITDDDLSLEKTLKTAVMISLFTDQRVTENELPYGETSRRGWFGDCLFHDDHPVLHLERGSW